MPLPKPPECAEASPRAFFVLDYVVDENCLSLTGSVYVSSIGYDGWSLIGDANEFLISGFGVI